MTTEIFDWGLDSIRKKYEEEDERLRAKIASIDWEAAKARWAREEREEAEKEAKKKAKKASEKRMLNNALAAFENGQWMQGYRLAKKTDMKDARLQYYMGCFYDEGYDFERSPEDAEMWYGEAAEQGHEEARRKLESMRKEGCCYNPTNSDEVVLLKCCHEAAENGNAEAQVMWGFILANYGYEKDASMWHATAESQGNAKVMYYIGNALEDGCLLEKDEKIALHYYREAAKLGDYGAMMKLKYQFNEQYDLPEKPKEELKEDYIKGKDGKYHRRVKTGSWLPLHAGWMSNELWFAVCGLHRIANRAMSKGLHGASLGKKIFGKERLEYEGYGTGALQKWADKMVKEGKDPYEVNLLEWFKGAVDAFNYHIGEGTFDEVMEKQKYDPDSFMRYTIERMQDYMPELRRMSRARIKEAIKQKYYTIRYAPFGIFGMQS